MKDFEKMDIDLIKDQTKYLNSIKNKIFNEGKVTLTTNDADTLDKVAQSLASFKLFLIADRFQKKICNMQ